GSQKAGFDDLLSRDTIGAQTFTRKHPDWDGRGVVVAVLDTGVDATVDGLRETSTGDNKVIVARDFSGQGDIPLTRAHRSVNGGIQVLRTRHGVARGVEHLDALVPYPAGGVWWLGFFEEADLADSGVRDVNRNQSTDDRFAVAACRTSDGRGAVLLIDTDGDGDLSDEDLRGSYEADPRTFSFTHPDPRKNQTPVAFSATAFPEGRDLVELHFDDGGHGTHVAGISTGYGIHGVDGFDGIAPGAKVMSLKIGNNTLSGGATTPGSMKRAFEFASLWATRNQTPVIINLSYGIGSEHEGQTDIDQVLTRVLEGNPLLAASVSAGNSGPGLSTVGTPAASPRAWTAGALLSRENAETLWGGGTDREMIFGFSSRGGELAKPDGVTPGVAWATTPPFMGWPVMAGTSMAAPQAAGAHALLVSAALATGTSWTSGSLKRAFRSTARPLKGYTSLDQGAGLVDVSKAWKALKKQASREPAGLLGWDVETAVPHRPGTTATASFWRTGSYIPEPPHTITVTVSPVFLATTTDADKRRFFSNLKLSSDERWVRVDRKRVPVRGDRSATLNLRLDPNRLKKPGLHLATVTATSDHGHRIPIPVVVIKPHRFNQADVRSQTFSGTLEPGGIERIFVEVPPGASAMSLTHRTPDESYGETWLKVFDPEGRQVSIRRRTASSSTGAEANVVLSGHRFGPGVWEIVPYASFRTQRASRWEMDVRFVGLDVPATAPWSADDSGGISTDVSLVNGFDQVYRGPLSARLLGRTFSETLELEGPSGGTQIELGEGVKGARVRLSMSAADYHKFADVAVNVVNAGGKTVVQDGFSQKGVELSFKGGPGTYSLNLVGGTSDPERAPVDGVAWSVDVEVTQWFKDSLSLKVGLPDEGTPTFYPGVPVHCDLSTDTPVPQLPDGWQHLVGLTLKEKLLGGAPLKWEMVLD
ncbi:MAG: S8 family serine peptidase, partial [Myxococcota bacterium]|nr:S8 family serine peptidase [Myxococcota bacterium]